MTERTHRRFVLRRLHSASGIFPIGAYLFVHIFFENAFVLAGGARFEMLVRAIGSLPHELLLATEVVFIWGPILFHSVYGFVRVGQAELYTAVRNDGLGASLYTLQRLTGVVAFLFIGWHVWSTRLQYYFFGADITFDFMRGIMTDPLRFPCFLVGVLACIFHFTNGLWTAGITWGLTVGPRAQRTLRAVAFGLFLAMSTTALAIMMAFRA